MAAIPVLDGDAADGRPPHERQHAIRTLVMDAAAKGQQGNAAADTLLDTLIALHDDCAAWKADKHGSVPAFLRHYGPVVQQLRGLRMNKHDFEVIKPLAKGQFGTVSIVRRISDDEVYAMKTLNKLWLLRQKEQAFFMEERDVLATAPASVMQWIPRLYGAFQDEHNLHLVMEYAAGGDLFSILDRRDPPVLSEEEARFYIAEIIVAISELHSMNYIHRDVKPSNILIDATGHIKLADFGSCIQLGEDGKVTSTVPVGTADYISPEVLRAREGNVGYGRECDWWSVGIVLYELLQGDPPFFSDTLTETYAKIMNHEDNLEFDDDVSEEGRDLIRRLVCDQSKRLGRESMDEIKRHPFFAGLDWDNIRQAQPPFVPTIRSADDTSNFSVADDDDVEDPVISPPRGQARDFAGNQLPFIGYTYLRDSPLHLQPSMRRIASSLSVRNQARLSVHSITAPNATLLSAEPIEKELANQQHALAQASLRALEEDNAQLADELAAAHSALEHTKAVAAQEAQEERKRLETEVRKVRALLEAAKRSAAHESDKRKEAEQELSSVRQRYEKEALLNADGWRNVNTVKQDLLKQVGELQQEVRRGNRMSTAKQQAHEACEEQLADAVKSVSDLEKHNAALQAEQRRQETAIRLLQEANNQLQSESLDAAQELAQSRATCRDLEKQQTLAKADYERLQREMQQTMERCTFLDTELARISALPPAQNVHADADLTTLRERLSAEDAAKQALHAELDQSSKAQEQQKMVVNVQQKLEDTRALLSAEAHARAELEGLRSELDSRCRLMESEQARVQSELTQLRQVRASTESDLSELALSQAHLSGDLRTVQALLDAETMARERADAQIAELEVRLQRETSSHAVTEQMLVDAQHARSKGFEQTNELIASEAQLRDELSAMRRKATEQAELLRMAVEDHEQMLIDLASERDTLAEDLRFVRACNQALVKEKNRWAQARETAALAEQGVAENNLEEPQSASLHPQRPALRRVATKLDKARFKDLQQNLEVLTRKVEELEAENSKLRDSVRSRDRDIERLQTASPVLEESENDADTYQYETPSGKRPAHVDVPTISISISISINRHRGMNLLVGMLCNERSFRNGLCGWLKISLAERTIKHGWKKKYVVVRDGKVFVYEREKHAERDKHGKWVIDLRSEVFSVRGVNKKELMHATSKTLESTFQVRATSIGLASLSSANMTTAPMERTASTTATISDSPDPIHLLRRAYELQREVTREEAIRQGAENQLSLVQDTSSLQHMQLQMQARNCAARLEGFRLELSRIEEQIEAAGGREKLVGIDMLSHCEQFQAQQYNIADTDLAAPEEPDREAIVRELERQIEVEESIVDAGKRLSQAGMPKRRSWRTGLDKEVGASGNKLALLRAELARVKATALECWGERLPILVNVYTSNLRLILAVLGRFCVDQQKLALTRPIYFMAADAYDCRRWILGLEHFRKDIRTGGFSSSTRSGGAHGIHPGSLATTALATSAVAARRSALDAAASTDTASNFGAASSLHN
ncbi:hypothetical protein THASP1DRAFT_22176 [Thamnocephalis sphaerospora]|uniref:non-specific serine/threonine protein kinase n=1 Tax=Thamnocephalis sphaerospora TaxID=78915 RepID=A0A4P9XWQ2_9FUNG|nr:hypothetical protein THASP1DRAFT_22176 [Thamnocephalis sphaerospora]|eukprot:RKP10071.1 hypothetical protein THASP1DRAFT_22176 [Thamnocephalis sphaerospora]